jgi:hypothetical protein
MIDIGPPPKFPRPAIILPRPAEIIRPGDPRFVVPANSAFPLTGLSGFGVGSSGALGYRYWRFSAITPGTSPQIAEITLTLGGVDQTITFSSGTGTSATQSGHTVSGDSVYGAGQEPWRAVAKDGTSAIFGSNAVGSGAYWKYDFGVNVNLDGYSLQCPLGSTTYMWTAWTFAASRDGDGVSFTTQDTRSGQTWSTSQIRSYSFTMV